MTVTVYGHELIPGSDVGMHFSATLALATAAAEEYVKAFRLMDPFGEPLGPLGIYEFVLTTPDITTLIDVLNSPPSVFPRCLSRKNLLGFVQG